MHSLINAENAHPATLKPVIHIHISPIIFNRGIQTFRRMFGLLCLAYFSPLAAGDFAARGIITLSQPAGTRIIQYSVAVSGRQWLIEYKEGDSLGACGCDGESIYSYIDDPNVKTLNGESIVFTNGVRTIPMAASIEGGSVPLHANTFVKLIWLAFASADYMTRNPEWQPIPPWVNPMVQPEAFIYGTKLEFLSNSNSLPRRITWVAKNKLIKIASTNTLLGVEPDPVRERNILTLNRFYDGFLGGDFYVIKQTHYAATPLPQT